MCLPLVTLMGFKYIMNNTLISLPSAVVSVVEAISFSQRIDLIKRQILKLKEKVCVNLEATNELVLFLDI